VTETILDHLVRLPAVDLVVRRLKSDPEKEASWHRILRTFGAVAPHVNSMASKSMRTGKEFVEFIETATGRGVESWESSDGTLRALAILIALESHPSWRTVLIEEPEQNLHPWAVRSIVDHIREVSEERHIQVVITTHSQQVLEGIKPEELLVTHRTQKDGTVFRNLTDLFPGRDIKMGEIGQLWVQGLLGGVPSHA